MFGIFKKKEQKPSFAIFLKDIDLTITDSNVCSVIRNDIWQLLSAQQKHIALNWLVKNYCEIKDATFPKIVMQEECENNSLIQSCNYEKNTIIINKTVFEQSNNIISDLYEVLEKCVLLTRVEKFNSPRLLKTEERFFALPFEMQKKYINTNKISETSVNLLSALAQESATQETFDIYSFFIKEFKLLNPTMESFEFGVFKSSKNAEVAMKVIKINKELNFSEQQIKELKTAVYNNFLKQERKVERIFAEKMQGEKE